MEAQRLEVRNRTDAARRQRDEYRRLAAVFRRSSATAAADAAENRAQAARLNADAWAALPDLAAVAQASAALEAHKAALRAAALDSAPALTAVEAAQADLAGSLDYHLREVAAQLDTLDEAETQATMAKDTAETEQLAAVNERARLDAERGEHVRSLERADARQRRLADEGIAEHGERLTSAAGRLEDTVTRLRNVIDHIKADIRDAATGRKSVRTELPVARRATEDATRIRDTLADESARISSAAADLACENRLRELAQAEEIDPIAESDDLLGALAHAVAAADATALNLRVEGAEDERAIAGLAAEGILPPRPAVCVVIDALTDAGFGPQSGWRYIAEHHAADAVGIINRMPEVADGVIVYGDPCAAASALDGLAVADAVVIARATIFSEPGAGRVVVGPSPARYEPAAATNELAIRRNRSSARREQLSTLAGRRRRDEELAARLRQLASLVPPDGTDGLAARLADAERDAGSATGTLTALANREEELDHELARLGEELDSLQSQLVNAEAGQRAVRAAVEEEQEIVGPARARLEALPGLLRAVAEAERRAVAAIGNADGTLESCRQQRVELETRQRDWTGERSSLGQARPNSQPLEACRAALQIAKTALREQFREGELRHNVEAAEQHLISSMTTFATHEPTVQERAKGLHGQDPAAQDAGLRAAAIRRARDAAERAQQELGAARSEVEAASREVAENTPADRPRHTQELRLEPSDRDHALRLAAAAAEEAATLQIDVTRLERVRDKAAKEARDWAGRAGTLRDQADKLPSVEPAATAAGVIDADDDQARRDVATLARRLEAVESAYASAMSARSQRADTLRTWAMSDRFAKVADDEQGMAIRQLRDLLRSESLVDRVAFRADALASDLRTRQKAIAQQIAQVEIHKHNVVVRLADLVSEAITDLSRASALSELPAGIGPWAGEQFLTVAARTRPTPEQVLVRVGELVDRMVTGGKIDSDPLELLWRATEASVTDGFRASILKPAPDQPPGRTSVEDMRKWSGGENLTASLILFCVLAKLRAENRTGAKAGATGGVVPLDNPLGKANYLPFLELQRKVAAANGVQLLFWTGIGDLAAVGAFPRIAAMRKKPAAGRPGTAYVVADDDASGTSDDVTHLVEQISSARVEQ